MIKVYIVEYKHGKQPIVEEVREFKTNLQTEIFINKFNLISNVRAAKVKGTGKVLSWMLVATRTWPIDAKYKENVFIPGSVEL